MAIKGRTYWLAVDEAANKDKKSKDHVWTIFSIHCVCPLCLTLSMIVIEKFQDNFHGMFVPLNWYSSLFVWFCYVSASDFSRWFSSQRSNLVWKEVLIWCIDTSRATSLIMIFQSIWVNVMILFVFCHIIMLTDFKQGFGILPIIHISLSIC